jgi:hypothetical protein
VVHFMSSWSEQAAVWPAHALFLMLHKRVQLSGVNREGAQVGEHRNSCWAKQRTSAAEK